jgi:NADH-quinone oxidoreductase subunit C/D
LTENSPADLIATLREIFSAGILEEAEVAGCVSLVVETPVLVPMIRRLQGDPVFQFTLLVDVVGIDVSGLARAHRFEVVYLLKSPSKGRRLMLRCRIPAETPHCPSIAGVFAIADWLEREVFDQFGIVFDGHPNLRRLLNHKDFKGHPLRKDYPLDQRQDFSTSDDLLDEMKTKLARMGRRSSDLQVTGELAAGNTAAAGENGLFLVNLGPSHPIVHGILRFLMAVEGETIVAMIPEIGYLHRGVEKSCEAGNYHQVIPFADRLNYASPVMNNIGYCKTVEKMLGITISERDRLLRVILLEINRIMDHLLCTGPHLVDLGALTPFWYLFQVREEFYSLLEKYSGARLTYSCVRIGSMPFTLYPEFFDEIEHVLQHLLRTVDDVRGLVERNRIFYDRCHNVGVIKTADALSHGFTGPCLRATGLDFDLRKVEPYYGYEQFDFSVCIGSNGDTYDRFFVRVYEMIESSKIVRQAIARLRAIPETETNNDAKKAKGFKKIAPPAGEIYDYTEAANGELGFYLVSDGSANPYRIKVRSPSLCNFSAIEHMAEGAMIADLVSTVGSLNIVGGEIDR